MICYVYYSKIWGINDKNSLKIKKKNKIKLKDFISRFWYCSFQTVSLISHPNSDFGEDKDLKMICCLSIRLSNKYLKNMGP